ncbi:hypothetical protein Pst134EB_014561 [Puccinia striiformis f. sp. tritici]|nr:hypothetical protein Pst134EB_014561 [Puccinia striiformis f. sp. tritici]
MRPTANQFHPEHPKPVNYSSPAKPGQPRWYCPFWWVLVLLIIMNLYQD